VLAVPLPLASPPCQLALPLLVDAIRFLSSILAWLLARTLSRRLHRAGKLRDAAALAAGKAEW
jgi:hypothetical protein